jgi:hypothetical protein
MVTGAERRAGHRAEESDWLGQADDRLKDELGT